MSETPQLTPKQALLVKYLAKGLSVTDAAKLAGYSENYPGQAGYQAMEQIRQKAPQLLIKHGLSEDSLIEKYLKPALEAEETEFAKFEGRITDSRNVVAWNPRLHALDMAFNLHGSYAPKDDKSQMLVGVKVVIEGIGTPDSQDSAPAETEETP